MRLSDRDIKAALDNEQITLSPYDPARLQPASYDILLGFEFLTFDTHEFEILDPKKDLSSFTRKTVLKDENDYFVLHPGEFALGVSFDRIGVDDSHTCELMGKSSLARLGLIIHTTAGFIDPGNTLNVTLELYNTNRAPIKLYPLMKIGQVVFDTLSSPCERSYGHASLGSKYLGSSSVEGSRMHENFALDTKK